MVQYRESVFQVKLRSRLALTSFFALLVPVLVTIAVAAAVVVENSSRSQELFFRSALNRLRLDMSNTEQRYRVSITRLAEENFLTSKLYVYQKYWPYISNDMLGGDIEVLKEELEKVLLSESIDTIAVYRQDGESFRSVLVVGNSTYIPDVVSRNSIGELTASPRYLQKSDGIYATLYMPVYYDQRRIGLVALQKAFNRGYFETLSLRFNLGMAFYAQGLYRYSSLPGIESAGVLWARAIPAVGRPFSGSYLYGNRTYNYVGSYFQMGSDAKGFLFVGGPSSVTMVDWWHAFAGLAGIPLICVVVATALFFMWGREIIGHIRNLVAASGQVAGGNYRVLLPVRRTDEFGELFLSFTRMAQNLAENEVRLEENKRQLVNTEKMAALGRFSAGVAHEINNPLGIILNHVQLLRSGRLSVEESGDFLRRIEAEIKRVSKLLRNLLHHTAEENLVFQEFNLAPLVTEVVQLFSPKLKLKGVLVDCATVSPDLIIEGDPDAVKQVLFNLLYNALQAIHHDQGRILVSGEQSADACILSVSDNGEGMDGATKEQIFQPFFTRKQGYGTGLGLVLSQRIMRQHGGGIEVRSEVNMGTTVTLRFPKGENT